MNILATIAFAAVLTSAHMYELGYCENGRCTTITDDKGICPPTSIQVGRRCVFTSEKQP